MAKKPRVPKTRAGETMTESAFWSFIRSGLRQKSRRWAPIYQCLQEARRPSKSKNKRLKWEMRCAKCKKWWPQKNVTVDHIKPCGQLRGYDDLAPFVATLFCEKDNLQALCSTCHDAKTQKERKKNAKNNDSEEVSG